ncbi:MAG: DUF975 family protein [Planctomycetia bacterium]|nr:DUF975 family protein [Planctomycetia bacterium]
MTSTEAKAGSETTLTAGDLFGRTFALWSARFVPNAMLSLLFHAPTLLIAWAVLGRGTPTEKTVESWDTAHVFLSSILGMLSSAATAYGSLRALRGQPATIGECAGRAFSSFGSLLLAGIVVGLLAFLIAIPIAFVVVVLVIVGTRTRFDANAVILGSVIGVIVTAVVQARYFLSSPAIVVERVGASNSLRESARLTRGFRWKIFFLSALLLGAEFAAGYIVGLEVDDPFTRTLATIAITILVSSPVNGSAAAIAYHRLKLRKDGINVLDAAKIFD